MVRDAMVEALDLSGNASSIHAEGRLARLAIENARAEVAHFTGTAPKNVVFTSGGTEALNLILTPQIEAPGFGGKPVEHLYLGAGEHQAVMLGHRFNPGGVTTIGLCSNGVYDLCQIEETLKRQAGRPFLLAMQAANNETGAVQPVKAAARLVHAAGGLLICDAVQAPGRSPCRFEDLDADAIVISAHKFGGPKGAGALCLRDDSLHISRALLRGGGQERGFRAGTENISAIVGFGAGIAALKNRMEEEIERLGHWRELMEKDLLGIAPQLIIFSETAERLPNTSCFALPGIEAQVLLMWLDVEGFAVSSGSACSSGKVKRSHVLTAMGIDQRLAEGAIRVSLGWNTSKEDCELFIQAFDKALRMIKIKQVDIACAKSAA